MSESLHSTLRQQMVERYRDIDPDYADELQRQLWDDIADDLEQERRRALEASFVNVTVSDELNPSGWPRPVLQATATRTKASGASTDRWPTPWISQLVQTTKKPKVALKEFNKARSDLAREQGLCQVCGEQCGERAFAPVQALDLLGRETVHVSGSPVCSVRCAKLAIALCPHFAINPALITFDLADITWRGLTFEFSITSYEVVSLA